MRCSASFLGINRKKQHVKGLHFTAGQSSLCDVHLRRGLDHSDRCESRKLLGGAELLHYFRREKVDWPLDSFRAKPVAVVMEL